MYKNDNILSINFVLGPTLQCRLNAWVTGIYALVKRHLIDRQVTQLDNLITQIYQ